MNKGTDQNIIKQLGISSNEYNLVMVLYYVCKEIHRFLLGLYFRTYADHGECQVPYIVLEAPSNLLLKKFSPSKWQSRIMVSWGVFLMCNTAVKNKAGLFTTRFLLGVVCPPSTFSYQKHPYMNLGLANPPAG